MIRSGLVPALATAVSLVAMAASAAEAPRTNRLAKETSPYLLRHATNPVDWYPWGDEAFRAARDQDKPVFLSIGYLTCHWCRVMEEESFEDAEVAAILNESFIAVKVDREERPDVDASYMAAARMLIENAGWPLNLFLTPDGTPFFAATYLPPEDRNGAPGLKSIARKLAHAWADRREQVLASAETIAEARSTARASASALDDAVLDRAFAELSARFDRRHGGFLPEPKFLSTVELRFLLRYWHRTGSEDALRMVEETVLAVRRSPVFDAIGHGVHRYATDRAWKEPHFEKMLYDQAMFALVATEAFKATDEPLYARIATETLDAMIAQLGAPSGAFHSALDAFSGGAEGGAYRWSAEGLARAAGGDADLASELFVLNPGGTLGTAPGAAWSDPRAEKLRLRLLEQRESRPRPAVDRKILADWNGLAIAALAVGGISLEEPRFTRRAEEAAEAILAGARDDEGALLHAVRGTARPIPALPDDYAHLAWGLIELHQASGDPRWLRAAIEIEEASMAAGGAPRRSPVSMTPALPETLSAIDTAVPAAASVHASNRIRIGRITGEEAWVERGREILARVASSVPETPSLASGVLAAVELERSPSVEIVLVGSPASEEMQRLVAATFGPFAPHKVVLRHSGRGNDPIEELAAYTEPYAAAAGESAIAFVCADRVCHLPTSDPATVRTLIERSVRLGSGPENQL